jgi:enoyl-CoA hydratase
MDGIRTESGRGFARITIERPPVNAFTVEMFAGLEATFDQLAEAGEPILITGADSIFSAGYDIKQQEQVGYRYTREEADTAARGCLRAAAAYPAPLIAAVEGAAIGFGLLLAAQADILVVSADTKIGMPEIKGGSVPDHDPLRRYLSAAWVRRLCLLGESVTAAEASLAAAGAFVCEPGNTAVEGERVVTAMADLDQRPLAATKKVLIG